MQWLVALSPDGRRLAVAAGRELLLFDLDTGKPAGTLQHEGKVFSPVWHADSRTLAVATWGNNDIHLWDAVLGKRLRTLTDQKGGEPVLAMSPSGQMLTSMSSWAPSGRVFWHPHTGKLLLRTPEAYWADSGANPVKLHPQMTVQDGRLYEATVDKTRITLRTLEPSPVFRILVPDPAGPPRHDCRHVTIHPGGRLLAVGHSNGVSLFDLATGLEVGRLALGWNLFARFDPVSGDLLTYGPVGLLRWPVRFPKTPGEAEVIVGPPRKLRKGGRTLDNFDVSSDGKTLVVANGSEAVVCREEGQQLVSVVLGPLQDTRFVHVSPDGQWVLSVNHGEKVGQVWNARTGQPVARLPVGTRGFSPHHGYCGMFFSHDSQWLTDGGRRWQVGTWQEACAPAAEGPPVLAFSADGALFVGQSNNESVHLGDARSGKTLVQLGLPEQSRCWFATFTPDGGQLLLTSADQYHVCTWDLHRLRSHLAELGLDWGPPVRAEPKNSVLAPPLHVEVVDAGGPAVPRR
jgi:WD40 repeat protein